MAPRGRKLALTLHVVVSVGWLGMTPVFIAFGVIALATPEPAIVRVAYRLTETAIWYVVVPTGILTLLTGLLSSLGTRWGLIQHWWVVFKLILNVVAVVVLLVYTRTVGMMADLATSRSELAPELRSPSLVGHATGGLLILLAATVLSVYKPRGLTSHGRRRMTERTSSARQLSSR